MLGLGMLLAGGMMRRKRRINEDGEKDEEEKEYKRRRRAEDERRYFQENMSSFENAISFLQSNLTNFREDRQDRDRTVQNIHDLMRNARARYNVVRYRQFNRPAIRLPDRLYHQIRDKFEDFEELYNITLRII